MATVMDATWSVETQAHGLIQMHNSTTLSKLFLFLFRLLALSKATQ